MSNNNIKGNASQIQAISGNWYKSYHEAKVLYLRQGVEDAGFFQTCGRV
jgi:hypothetical protein